MHHSRIIRFLGRELPYLERMAELYWGESEVEALYQDVVKHNNVAANMAALTFRANVDRHGQHREQLPEDGAQLALPQCVHIVVIVLRA